MICQVQLTDTEAKNTQTRGGGRRNQCTNKTTLGPCIRNPQFGQSLLALKNHCKLSWLPAPIHWFLQLQFFLCLLWHPPSPVLLLLPAVPSLRRIGILVAEIFPANDLAWALLVIVTLPSVLFLWKFLSDYWNRGFQRSCEPLLSNLMEREFNFYFKPHCISPVFNKHKPEPE